MPKWLVIAISLIWSVWALVTGSIFQKYYGSDYDIPMEFKYNLWVWVVVSILWWSYVAFREPKLKS